MKSVFLTALLGAVICSASAQDSLQKRAQDCRQTSQGLMETVDCLIGAQMPRLQLENLNGERQTISAKAGKLHLLFYWEPFCTPCLEMLPALDSLTHYFKQDRIQFTSIVWTDAITMVNEFLPNYTFSWPIFLDPEMEAHVQLGIIGLPTLLLFDKKGKLVYLDLGGSGSDSPMKDYFGELSQKIKSRL